MFPRSVAASPRFSISKGGYAQTHGGDQGLFLAAHSCGGLYARYDFPFPKYTNCRFQPTPPAIPPLWSARSSRRRGGTDLHFVLPLFRARRFCCRPYQEHTPSSASRPMRPSCSMGRMVSRIWAWGSPSFLSCKQTSAHIPAATKLSFTYSRTRETPCSRVSSWGRAISISRASWAFFAFSISLHRVPQSGAVREGGRGVVGQ